MAAYRDSNGKWYVSVYYDTWEGKRSRKVKRGFATKRAALEWEREFLGKEKGDMDGTQISIDCGAVETALDVNTLQRGEMDWLIYNKPLEYAQMVFSGKIEAYVRGRAEHRLMD